MIFNLIKKHTTTVSYTVPRSTFTAPYILHLTTATQHNTRYYLDKIIYSEREDTTAVSTYVDDDLGLNHPW